LKPERDPGDREVNAARQPGGDQHGLPRAGRTADQRQLHLIEPIEREKQSPSRNHTRTDTRPRELRLDQRGSIAVQLARDVGALVIGTGRAADRDTAIGLGVDAFLDLQADKLEDGGEVDVVFDVIGGEILDRSTALVRDGGTLVTIARVPTVQPKDGRAIFLVVEPDRFRLADLAQRLRDGRLKPIVGAVRPLAEAPAAFAPGRRTPARRSSGSPKADRRYGPGTRADPSGLEQLAAGDTPPHRPSGTVVPSPALAHPPHRPKGSIASESPSRRFEPVDPEGIPVRAPGGGR
jgi:hypothetical protein